MNKRHTFKPLLFIALLGLALVVTSCSKSNDNIDSPTPQTSVGGINPLATLGLIEYAKDGNKRIFIGITKIGDVPTNYYGVFDTGSTGMTMDASGLIPANMITPTGITFTGDSINVNGITITNKRSTMAYGDKLSSTTEYGYLAYAPITIGDQNGKITTKRIPFFMYYKIVDEKGNVYPKSHSSDVFGVGPGTSYASTSIASPISYFDIPTGVTNGFKLATIPNTGFDTTGTYVAALLTIGLVPADLTSSGFIMHPLSYSSFGGYLANIPSTITYGSKTYTGDVLFDTGTPAVATLEDKTATAIGNLPVNTRVTVTTNKGFTYSYLTTSTGNLTEVQNPNNTGDSRTIFALDFFINNEYLTDYANHQIGLKNN